MRNLRERQHIRFKVTQSKGTTGFNRAAWARLPCPPLLCGKRKRGDAAAAGKFHKTILISTNDVFGCSRRQIVAKSVSTQNNRPYYRASCTKPRQETTLNTHQTTLRRRSNPQTQTHATRSQKHLHFRRAKGMNFLVLNCLYSLHFAPNCDAKESLNVPEGRVSCKKVDGIVLIESILQSLEWKSSQLCGHGITVVTPRLILTWCIPQLK